jgi:hypothetical protein
MGNPSKRGHNHAIGATILEDVIYDDFENKNHDSFWKKIEKVLWLAKVIIV